MATPAVCFGENDFAFPEPHNRKIVQREANSSDVPDSVSKTVLIQDGLAGADFWSEIKSDFLVSAVGQLNQPKWPEIEGITNFAGKKMHSARWDWSYDPQDKKIALLGNGKASASSEMMS